MIKRVFIFLLLCSGCTSNVPDNVLEPSKMKFVVADLMQVDEFMNNYQYRDSATDLKKRRSELYKRVFVTHNITHKQFYSSYQYYQRHPGLHATLFDSLYNYFDRLKAEPLNPLPVKKLPLKAR